jgi:uncharacterized protein YecE (DUF72 family)
MPRDRPTQLPLELLPGQDAGPSLEAAATAEELLGLRARLPGTIQLGTCGWVYPGWRELVWQGAPTAAELERHGLSAYARHPLLTAIYIEPVHDAVPLLSDLRLIAEQLPPEMHCLMQVHPEVTTPRFTHADPELAIGREGSVNPHFLDSRFFLHEVLEVYQAAFGERLGPFLFVFPPQLEKAGIGPDAFASRLQHFLRVLPEDLAYAIEIREPTYLTRQYAKLLAAFNVSHVFTTAAHMPPLLEQAQLVAASPELIVHVVDPTTEGASRRQRLEPFDQIRDRDPTTRREIVRLLTAMRGVPSYVLVHNEAEGSAPLTILALARMLVAGG